MRGANEWVLLAGSPLVAQTVGYPASAIDTTLERRHAGSWKSFVVPPCDMWLTCWLLTCPRSRCGAPLPALMGLRAARRDGCEESRGVWLNARVEGPELDGLLERNALLGLIGPGGCFGAFFAPAVPESLVG